MALEQRVEGLIGAGGIGLGTALLGVAVPVVGLAGGIILVLAAPNNPDVARHEDLVDGIVDGSLALLVYSLLKPSP